MAKVSGKIQAVFLYGIFVFYILLLLTITVFKYVSPLALFDADRVISRSVNLIPFHTIYSYLSGNAKVSDTVIINNILGNICLFIPLGIYLQLFFEKKSKIDHFFIIFFSSFIIEAIQYCFGIGATDIDDLILNSLGGMFGTFLYLGLNMVIKDRRKVRSIITICSSVIGVPMLFLVVLILMNQ